MSSVFRQPLIAALGVVFAGATTLTGAAAVNTSFKIKPLVSGYALAGAAGKSEHADSESKCGEGKCGLGMMDTNKDGKVSPEESKAGKFSEHQFKAWDKNGDGMLDKSELDAMHAVKGKEGYCS
jgi:EF hand